MLCVIHQTPDREGGWMFTYSYTGYIDDIYWTTVLKSDQQMLGKMVTPNFHPKHISYSLDDI